ncbi:MAG: DUF6017 domain-containing protein [Lachnospiraceae bacterium]|nr:DUF6017 domain-containing protein [Lachnospiraceae bacterium]
MTFNYYYGSEADQFNFIRIPKSMITDPMFASLSLASKLLYGILLDRMNLSMKNRWFDSENKVYIIYQIAEIQEDMGLTEKMAIKHLKELESFGLVEKKRRGLGLPSLLYVKSFLVPKDYSAEDECSVEEAKTAGSLRTVEMASSRSVEIGSLRTAGIGGLRTTIMEAQELPGQEALISNTYLNNTNLNYTKSNQIISDQKDFRCDNDEMYEVTAYLDLIKVNIDYGILLERYPYDKELINGILDLMLETVLNQGKTILIASNQYPTQLVKSKFLKLDSNHIEYVIGCFQENTTKIKNIKKYILAALFNASTTINGYYQAEVNHELPQFTRNKRMAK